MTSLSDAPRRSRTSVAILSLTLAFVGPMDGLRAQTAPVDQLAAGFVNPPREARLRCYWWWLNGHVTEAGITRDLEAMKSKGFGGAIIVDAGGADQRGNQQVPAGPVFGGPEWRKLYRHALAEANRLDLELSLNILSGWNLGGPGVEPGDAAKLAVWSKVTATGPTKLDQSIPAPSTKTGFYRDVVVLAYPLKSGVDPRRPPIRELNLKSASKEAGGSTPDTRGLLHDTGGTPGEEDAEVRQVVDISDQMDASGLLRWTVPPGQWEILRFGYAASGAQVSTGSETWSGLAIDYLDHEALERYWRRVVSPLIDDARPYLGKTLKYLVTDSWELGGVNWTARFREEFQRRRGYDILPWLPVMTGRIIQSREDSNRFLNDLRRTIGDLVADEHYRAFERLAARDGLGIHPESGGPHGAPIDAIRNLGIGAFPQMEFWAKAKTHRVTDEERYFVKEAASAAHVYGKTFVAAEGLTSIGPQWEETIWDNLKPSFDKAICEGLNLLVWHTFTSSPPEMGVPGQEYFAGTHFNPNITWWNQAGAFTSYLNRTTYMMQQGQPVADVLYYYGDHVPNFVRLKTTDPAHVLPGYDYDAIDLNALLTRVEVRDGRLVLPDGVSYRVLVLPEMDTMSLAALRRIATLARAGATVVGAKPKGSSSLTGGPTADGEFAKLADEIWGASPAAAGERKLGTGRIVWGHTAREVLQHDGIGADFEFTADAPGANLDYIHRHVGSADIFFVSNQAETPATIRALFRVDNREPELWNPATGRMRSTLVYAAEGGRTSVPLHLGPYESVFIVFRKPAGLHYATAEAAQGWVDVFAEGGKAVMTTASSGAVKLTTAQGRVVSVPAGALPAPVTIAGPWTVRFAPGWGAPASTTFDRLVSWTENRNPDVRYFSGTAVYTKEITIAPALLASGRALQLDLGEVRELATVKLNGNDLGVVWTMPRVVDITAAAHAGANTLEIEVTNLWPNRLIGDQLLPEAQRRTHTNIRKFTATSPLIPSGLLGPVTLRSVARIPVELPR